MTNIINPTIDLFLYDFIKSLDDDKKDIDQKREYFEQKLHETVRNKLEPDGQENNQNLEAEEDVPLLKYPYYATLDSDPTLENDYYFPVRLENSYGLLLEVAAAGEKTPEYFAELKAKIQEKLKENIATLGETWMLSTYLTASSETTTEEIAKECYKAIFPDAEEIEFVGKDELLGARIFEYSDNSLKQKRVPLEDKEILTFVQTQHIIIAIYPDQEAFQKLADFYTDWMRLFYHHHTIIWTYGKTRILTNQIKERFSKIQTTTKSIEKNIAQENAKVNKLQETINILSQVQVIINQYTSDINSLKFQKAIIEIDLNEYDKKLQEITKKFTNQVVYNQTNISFLEEFSQQVVKEKYLLQITKDLDFFELRLGLLEGSIKTLSSQVEIEKDKSDRDFQELIAVAGAGVAFASLAGFNVTEECQAIYGFFIKKIIFIIEFFNENFFLEQNTLLHKFKLDIIESCKYTTPYKFILFLFASLLVWFIRRFIFKRS